MHEFHFPFNLILWTTVYQESCIDRIREFNRQRYLYEKGVLKPKTLRQVYSSRKGSVAFGEYHFSSKKFLDCDNNG